VVAPRAAANRRPRSCLDVIREAAAAGGVLAARRRLTPSRRFGSLTPRVGSDAGPGSRTDRERRPPEKSPRMLDQLIGRSSTRRRAARRAGLAIRAACHTTSRSREATSSA